MKKTGRRMMGMLLLVASGIISGAQADVITNLVSTADSVTRELRASPAEFLNVGTHANLDGALQTVDVFYGLATSSLASKAVILPVLIPAVPAGESIGGASFKVRLNGLVGTTPQFNVDLYALNRFSSTGSNLLADHWASGSVDLGSTLLQADFLTPGAAIGFHSFSGSMLTTFLNQAIADGHGGEYMFFRLSMDKTPQDLGTNHGTYRFNSANDIADRIPFVEFTIVPKPVLLNVALEVWPESNGVALKLNGTASPGRSYTIQSKADLRAETAWTEFTGWFPGTGGAVTVMADISKEQSFYRGRVAAVPQHIYAVDLYAASDFPVDRLDHFIHSFAGIVNRGQPRLFVIKRESDYYNLDRLQEMYGITHTLLASP